MIAIEDLQQLRIALNIKQVCELAGIPAIRIYKKIQRGGELKVDESKAIQEALISLYGPLFRKLYPQKEGDNG